MSPFGVAHGVAVGGVTRNDTSCGYTNPAAVVLCGDTKAELSRFFPLSDIRPAPGVGVRVSDLTRYSNDRPDLRRSKSYLPGRPAGYFASDGSVSNGECSASSAGEANVRRDADVRARLGVATNHASSRSRVGFGTKETEVNKIGIAGRYPRSDYFVRADRRAAYDPKPVGGSRPPGRTLVSVEPSGEEEEVFCAVVPDGAAFVLEGTILTGNRSGACVKAGQNHFLGVLRDLPAAYAYFEAGEESARSHLGKDVAILRDGSGGKTTPMTLRELRLRQANGVDCDAGDANAGCGCFSAAYEEKEET